MVKPTSNCTRIQRTCRQKLISTTTAARPPLDIAALVKKHAGENYELHAKHVNPANVRTLKTIGFDRCYTRATGPYLWDVKGEKYLDLLGGYGVFGLGRNHPEICRVLKEFLDPIIRAW
jgi:ornithine--oxo-acid transaminase